ncbi:hypothetical protein SBD_2072 [Streptomyces bottropensis ATCC 25435]|uniref:Uncharacterized protein n=1 Tax=Streptomyces bottropensis ATCC 25435 TaxID=1054862 RepID=M3EJG4_9ACTN|nr:hypothetical protein SBD_2072 [Streptomyces bottropensis ATCC 25435]
MAAVLVYVVWLVRVGYLTGQQQLDDGDAAPVASRARMFEPDSEVLHRHGGSHDHQSLGPRAEVHRDLQGRRR